MGDIAMADRAVLGIIQSDDDHGLIIEREELDLVALIPMNHDRHPLLAFAQIMFWQVPSRDGVVVVSNHGDDPRGWAVTSRGACALFSMY